MVNFMKSASSLRLSYMLRAAGYTVLQVHNCLSFTTAELHNLLENFSRGEQILVCISTSFINTTVRKNIILDESNMNEGDLWGEHTFAFFQRLGRLVKTYKFPVLMGGWEIEPYKFLKEYR